MPEKEWSFGIELFYSNKNQQSKLILFMKNEQIQKQWVNRFDKIIESNKSIIALRLNRDQRQIEKSVREGRLDSINQYSVGPDIYS